MRAVRRGRACDPRLSAQRCVTRTGQGGMAPPLKRSTATVIQVKVKPNSRISAFEQAEGGTWLARLRSAPVDGKANAELIALVAEHYQCPKSAVSIKSGASGRIKLVRIDARWGRGLDGLDHRR